MKEKNKPDIFVDIWCLYDIVSSIMRGVFHKKSWFRCLFHQCESSRKITAIFRGR